ncbi:MAG: LysR family transcriptional regulator [Gammaproteobacteria bacterium]|nr:LysR family transcriptional regulator [Gammaproteobacteria bacterium]
MNIEDWNYLRSFLLVAKLGSLAAAARALGSSQSTLTRDIQNLELETGLNLFRRTTRGMQLTASGQGLVDAASDMQEAYERFARIAGGLSEALEGEVRISANEIVGRHLLPAAIVALRKQHPHLQVEIVITNEVSSLSKREADIAFRMFRPTQPELVSKRLPDMHLGFYAHCHYIAEHGRPASIDELTQFDVINADKDREFLDGAAEMGFHFLREDFVLRTDDLSTQINLARAGAGIVGMHKRMACLWPELHEVLPDLPLPPLEFWLVCHGDVQYNQRIRETMTFFSQWFAEDAYRGMMG